MKRIFLLLLTLIATYVANADDLYQVTASRLNVRSAPSTSAAVLGAVSRGDVIEVVEITNGWATFFYKGNIGYASSKYLTFVRHIESQPPVAPPVATPSSENKTREESSTSDQNSSQNLNNQTYANFGSDEISTLINGPVSISSNFDLYYGLDLGFGYSTFKWDGKWAGGKSAMRADLFFELNFRNKVLFFPKNYFMEFRVGADDIGANRFSMNYVSVALYPFGYKMHFNKFAVGAKLGVNIGFPLNDIQSPKTYKSDIQFDLTAGVGVEYKQWGLYAVVEPGLLPVNNAPVDMFNLSIMGVLSYKFGKLTHKK